VAGNADEVAGVVHELVHEVPTDHRRSALFGRDQVEGDEEQQRPEDRLREQLPHRDRGGQLDGGLLGVDHCGHVVKLLSG
jgi:hypothetical protein